MLEYKFSGVYILPTCYSDELYDIRILKKTSNIDSIIIIIIIIIHVIIIIII